eukprot:TRINITY_DN7780_c0_g1_i3.p2 TRINITY_DN7780_c0_g1~~TRINITY_DN7780_c0_g1_i3.p2  ORF type:complete len:241 (+),score=0.16 TRINITY_DN7780_c0_g1_i3:3286-4008(+)
MFRGVYNFKLYISVVVPNKIVNANIKNMFKVFERIKIRILLFSQDNQVNTRHVNMYIKCTSINKKIMTTAHKFIQTKQQQRIRIDIKNKTKVEKIEKLVTSKIQQTTSNSCIQIKSKRKRFEYNFTNNSVCNYHQQTKYHRAAGGTQFSKRHVSQKNNYYIVIDALLEKILSVVAYQINFQCLKNIYRRLAERFKYQHLAQRVLKQKKHSNQKKLNQKKKPQQKNRQQINTHNSSEIINS